MHTVFNPGVIFLVNQRAIVLTSPPNSPFQALLLCWMETGVTLWIIWVVVTNSDLINWAPDLLLTQTFFHSDHTV